MYGAKKKKKVQKVIPILWLRSGFRFGLVHALYYINTNAITQIEIDKIC